MISPERLFENFFDDQAIINVRLYNFSVDTLTRLTAANGGGDYTDLITLITAPINKYGNSLGLLDVSITLQKGKTFTNNQVMSAFQLTMSSKEGAIAEALGGRDTEEYLQFYPQGRMEYTRAGKTQMPILTHRVNVAATENAAALGATLTTLLQGFEAAWTTSRNTQETVMATVDDTRNDRSDFRVDVELVLCTVVHTIAARFPGDVASCMSFFDFTKLFNFTHHKSIEKSGDLGPNETKVIANLTFDDTMALQFKNTDNNSNFLVYLGAMPSSAVGDKSVLIKANKGKRPKPSDLGNLSDTFLLIKNLSAVNNGSFYVKIKGVADSGDDGDEG